MAAWTRQSTHKQERRRQRESGKGRGRLASSTSTCNRKSQHLWQPRCEFECNQTSVSQLHTLYARCCSCCLSLLPHAAGNQAGRQLAQHSSANRQTDVRELRAAKQAMRRHVQRGPGTVGQINKRCLVSVYLCFCFTLATVPLSTECGMCTR